MELAGVDVQTEGSEGGVLGREEGSMEPNWYLEESALELVRGSVFENVEMNFSELIVEV